VIGERRSEREVLAPSSVIAFIAAQFIGALAATALAR